jgi:hypothetical protein
MNATYIFCALCLVLGFIAGWSLGWSLRYGVTRYWERRAMIGEGAIRRLAAMAGTGADLQVIHDAARQHLDGGK